VDSEVKCAGKKWWHSSIRKGSPMLPGSHKDFTTQEPKNMLKTEQPVAILLLSHRAHFAKN
jgi:hypothetical protein